MSAKADIWMPLYIGDYLRDTTRLTTAQHGAYLLLIMDYWTNGAPPDDDEVLASITRSTPEEWPKIRSALSSKFQIEGGVWRHGRIDREIDEAQENKAKRLERSRAGNLAKANKRADKATYEEAHKETSKVTSSPSPSPSHNISSSSKKKAPALGQPIGVSDEVWQSFLMIRKAKKAPVTDLAILGIRREAVKAGIELEQALTICCERGWASFKAEWMQSQQARPQAQSFYERDQQLKREEARKWGGGSSSSDPFTIEAEVTHVAAIESD